ncbi:Uncharacterised protein [Pannonibacter phragmitetus]|uniref:Uncharacterized protein n=1 Tax=Pannonibacter phragmitetus TaxID=121719 RepID=A0A378ZYC5_9HYPH|nr:hypothetical protein [Pannonibacter phragmitetus]SUB02236.1 Uncharacterised protein [Pannonibacter phragmitetus]
MKLRSVSGLGVLVLALFISGQAGAQSLKPSDIKSKIDAKVATVSEYQALLNDSDPNRSMAAMEVMLESGDPKLVRMALDYGIYSPNPVVQRLALEGFLSSAPNMSIYTNVEGGAKDARYKRSIHDYLYGSVDAAGQGYFVAPIGAFNPETRCYPSKLRNTACFLTISDLGVSIEVLDRKAALRMNDKGELVGEVKLPDVEKPVTLRVPISN